jgi:hypothetical protein
MTPRRRSPNCLYVGDDVEMFVEHQGWLPGVLTRVHPSYTVERVLYGSVVSREPVSAGRLRSVSAEQLCTECSGRGRTTPSGFAASYDRYEARQLADWPCITCGGTGRVPCRQTA